MRFYRLIVEVKYYSRIYKHVGVINPTHVLKSFVRSIWYIIIEPLASFQWPYYVRILAFYPNNCHPRGPGNRSWNLDLWLWRGGHMFWSLRFRNRGRCGQGKRNLAMTSAWPWGTWFQVGPSFVDQHRPFLIPIDNKAALQNHCLGFELKWDVYTQWKRDQPWNQAAQGDEAHVKDRILSPNGPPMSVLRPAFPHVCGLYMRITDATSNLGVWEWWMDLAQTVFNWERRKGWARQVSGFLHGVSANG